MRQGVLATVLALIALPALVALLEASAFHARNRNNGSIVSSGERREYLLYVPASYDPGKPTPLVISLHGGAGWPALQRDLTGWNRLAERYGFLVVYPAGLDVGGMTGWQAFRPGAGLSKDVRFLSDLMDELGEVYNIDAGKIYANGLSNGGAMAFVLSCALSHRIAAVGVVAGAQLLPWSWCEDPRAMPMVAFHGTADRLVPYVGGTSWVSPKRAFSNIPEWVEGWARRNRCRPEARESAAAPDVLRREFPDCAGDAPVVLFTVLGGGHTWPGSKPLPEWFLGPTTASMDATAEMWSFFEGHRLPAESRNDGNPPGEGTATGRYPPPASRK